MKLRKIHWWRELNQRRLVCETSIVATRTTRPLLKKVDCEVYRSFPGAAMGHPVIYRECILCNTCRFKNVCILCIYGCPWGYYIAIIHADSRKFYDRSIYSVQSIVPTIVLVDLSWKSVPNAPWAAIRSALFTPPQASDRVALWLSW